MSDDKDLRELAEFATEFLKNGACDFSDDLYRLDRICWEDHSPVYGDPWGDQIPTRVLFDCPIVAPALARLAKRKMEKMGWYWNIERALSYLVGIDTKWIHDSDGEYEYETAHENEYIALWMAIRDAIKEEV